MLLTEEAIEDASIKAAVLGLRLSEIRVSPETLAEYNKFAFGKERIILAGGTEEMKKYVRKTSVMLACHKPDDEAYGTDQVTMILVGDKLLEI